MQFNKKIFLFINIGLLFFLICMLTCIFIQTDNTAYKKVLPGIVGIRVGQYRGNGCILHKDEEKVILVTTRHLLDNGDDVDVTFYDKSKVKGQVIFLSDQHDAGFVCIAAEQLTKETYKKIRAVKYRERQYKKLKQNDKMQYGIMDHNDIVSVKQGKIGNPNWYVEEFGDYMLYNYCEAVPGMSGCGAFDEHGNYIGMLIGGYDNESACLPVNTILELYKKLDN